MNGEKIEDPILQFLNFELLSGSTTAGLKYKLELSDGQNRRSFILLSPMLSHMVSTNVLTKWSIIKIKKFILENSKNGNEQR